MKKTIPKLLTLVCLLVAIMGLSIVTAHAATVTGTISGGNEYRYHEDKTPVPQWGAFTSTKLKYFTRDDKRWSRTIFVPEDGGHRHTFLINSHPAILDGFVSNYRAELAKLHLFGAEHCEPNSGEQDFTGRVLVLSPDTLRESCWQPENQLWLASGGFGCRPHARGRSVFCTCLGDGETTRWNRSEFVGIIRDECIPDWAAEKLAELRQSQNAPAMGEMTM